MRVLPAGDRAVLVELASLDEVHRLHRAVRDRGLGVDSVPGWTTLLVTTDGDVRALAADLQRMELPPGGQPTDTAEHEIPVVYDGEDLPHVAEASGLTPAEVVALHAGAAYVVAFLGFSPGFPYLSGLPAALQLPRRKTPRTRVPAGSVAIAGEWCGIYPHASPGGWQLLGRTTLTLFDPERTPPTPLSPGDHVRFAPL